jgi:hypothetical protein
LIHQAVEGAVFDAYLHLLALNATVEAARSGDAGKGATLLKGTALRGHVPKL